jgi:hypothetical protein
MKKRFQTLKALIVIALFTTACGTQSVRAKAAEQTAGKMAPYEIVLGESLTDPVVADFLASNNCSSTLQFRLCKDVGMALLLDSNQVVETVFLYLNKAPGFLGYEEDFTPYKGELPLGLKFYDTMGAAVYKLNRQGVGEAGLPDSTGTPDHTRYMAIYKKAGITIIYNAQSAEDEDATIYAILVSK